MINTAKWFRAASMLLAVVMLCTSCGFVKWNDGETAPVTEETDAVVEQKPDSGEQSTEKLPEPAYDEMEEMRGRLLHIKNYDLSASSVIIATVDGTTVCPMTSDGDPVIAARVDAKRAVEEKFGTTVITRVADRETMLKDAREAYNSDMYYADLLVPHAEDVGLFYAEGLLANLYSLPHVNFDAEYYDSDVFSAAVAGDGIYAVSGAANFNPEYLCCVFYNRTLAEALGMGDLTELVKNGLWTFDKYGELAKLASASLGISGHGSAYELSVYTEMLAVSQGVEYMSNDERTLPVVDYLEDSKAERTKAVVDRISGLIYSDNTFTKSEGDDCRLQFTAQTLMFSVDSLYYSQWISDNSVEWGLLPLPKYDESVEQYRTLMSSQAPVFCALANTPGYETSGLILESLNAASHGYTLGEYRNYMIDYVLRDSGSISMLDIICDSAVYDFAHMYASGIPSLDAATYGALYKAVSTKRSIDSYYKNYKGTVNRAISALVYVSK